MHEQINKYTTIYRHRPLHVPRSMARTKPRTIDMFLSPVRQFIVWNKREIRINCSSSDAHTREIEIDSPDFALRLAEEKLCLAEQMFTQRAERWRVWQRCWHWARLWARDRGSGRKPGAPGEVYITKHIYFSGCNKCLRKVDWKFAIDSFSLVAAVFFAPQILTIRCVHGVGWSQQSTLKHLHGIISLATEVNGIGNWRRSCDLCAFGVLDLIWRTQTVTATCEKSNRIYGSCELINYTLSRRIRAHIHKLCFSPQFLSRCAVIDPKTSIGIHKAKRKSLCIQRHCKHLPSHWVLFG